MKRSIYLLSIFLLILSCNKQDNKIAPSSSSSPNDDYFNEINFNGAASVTYKGEIIYRNSFGYADKDNNTKSDLNSKYYIGSLTKQFTAMGILILKESNKLNLSDKIILHLNDIPSAWNDITIHQLLTHTSGLMHSWALDAWETDIHNVKTIDQNIALFHGEPLLSTSGTSYSYSGLGYFILARIIETASGKSYSDFLRLEIFDKLNMENSGTGVHGLNESGIVTAYENLSTNTESRDIYMPNLSGGGDIYSTPTDLAKWFHGISNYTLISKSSTDLMYTPEKNNYCYGWVKGSTISGDRYFHGGGLPGFKANIDTYPSQDLAIILLSNEVDQDWADINRYFTYLVRSNINGTIN